MLCNDKITLVEAKPQEINHIVVPNGRVENVMSVEHIDPKWIFPYRILNMKWLELG